MIAMFNGQPLFGPQGPRGFTGPDGNPIGTIISYMGLTAPQDYLVCDGAEYNIADYSDLARFFETQFGTSNHFGGDGTTTFAVPDLRNLFLRGYHGEAVEQLSGEVGKRQEGTQFPYYESTLTSSNVVRGSATVILPTDVDTKPGTSNGVYHNGGSYDTGTKSPLYFTSRPVNTAVLYCIKAVTSVPAEDVYSTEERVVGRWIDGKPLYRKIVINGVNGTVVAENVYEVTKFYGVAAGVNPEDMPIYGIPAYNGLGDRILLYMKSGVVSIISEGFAGKYTLNVTMEYTKTTD